MKIYFITSNADKFKEVDAMLGTIQGIKLSQLDQSYPEIQSDSLEEIVKFGLEWLSNNIDKKYLNQAIMLEDSGLFVERLRGFPGVYSAYVHTTIGGYKAILTLLEGEWDRRAQFKTYIGFVTGNEPPKYFFGTSEGTIAPEARGTEGFGYDPIFIPDGDKRTFAEMKTNEKNRFSHRGKALESMKNYLAGII